MGRMGGVKVMECKAKTPNSCFSSPSAGVLLRICLVGEGRPPVQESVGGVKAPAEPCRWSLGE